MSHIDLHTHSTASDGTDSPAQLVEAAKKAGLEAIAITDHDTISGIKEAREAAKDLGIELIGGCEVSTSTEIGSMHILGLWLPEDANALENFLAHMLERRTNRNEQMIAKLRLLGIDISMEEMLERVKGSLGRPHMAKFLVEKGYVGTMDEAFTEYLGIGGKAYVPKVAPTPEQSVRLLAELGATVSIAHPFLRAVPPEWLESLVTTLKPCGLSALEAWHSAHSAETSRNVVEMAKRHNLAISGGSDYHGSAKPNIRIGEVAPGVFIPGEILKNLKKQRMEKGLPC